MSANRSVWFTWTAPSTGLARVSSCGSGFDSVVAVYGGTTLSGIYATRLANNDNGCGGPTDAAVVYLRVQAGTTYRIALDGWTASDAGSYQLVAQMLGDPGPPPANDDVAAGVPLSGETTTATGTNVGATSWRRSRVSPARRPRSSIPYWDIGPTPCRPVDLCGTGP